MAAKESVNSSRDVIDPARSSPIGSEPKPPWPQWTEEDVERNFILVRKILRKLGLKIRISNVDLTLTRPFQQHPLMECSISVDNYLPDYFQIKTENESQTAAAEDATHEFCRLMEYNCLISKSMYDAWTHIYPLYLRYPHLFDRIASKVERNFSILNSEIPIHVNTAFPQGNYKKIIDEAFDRVYERINAEPDSIEHYTHDLRDLGPCSCPSRNKYGVVPNSSRFRSIISQLRTCQLKFPQEFRHFEHEVRVYVEIFEEKDSEKILKGQAVERLMEDIRRHPGLRDGKLIIVGSTMNTTAVSNADLDLHFHAENIPEKQRPSLNQLYDHLNRSSSVCSIISIDIATVPILQVAMQPPFDSVRIEISSNSCHSVYTTHLVRHYMKLDWRARYLSILVKQWAVVHKIRMPSHGTMSGIALVLMVIHFLQCGCDPPILPNLQIVRKDLFSESIPVEFLADVDELNYPEGRTTCRDFLPVGSDRRRMYVDEPYAHFNTLRSLADFDLVLQSIKDAFHLLNGPCLDQKPPDFRRLMHQGSSL